jgi:hypothetical protein
MQQVAKADESKTRHLLVSNMYRVVVFSATSIVLFIVVGVLEVWLPDPIVLALTVLGRGSAEILQE